MKYLKILIFCSVFLAGINLITSCNNVSFADNNVFKESQWLMKDTVSFQLEIEDTINPQSFYLNVRNNQDYPFRRIYLFVETELPGNISGKDTLEIILAEANGKWIGKGNGSIKENDLLIREGFKFTNKGIHTFKFVHGMRTDTLKGLESLGIRIESSK